MWHSLLHNFLQQWDPTVYLCRRIPSAAPPKGKATKAWVQCVKALTNLLGQNEHLNLEGTYQPDPLYDQLTMMAQCLPILLLLRLPKPFSPSSFVADVTSSLPVQGHGASLPLKQHVSYKSAPTPAPRPPSLPTAPQYSTEQPSTRPDSSSTAEQ
jgi:hypothetical protein